VVDEAIQAKGTTRVTRGLSWALAALMAVQSAVGILVPSAYRDVLWIRTAWLGTDVVTLFVVVPLLVWGLLASRRGSTRGELLWFGALGYGVYNNAYYMLGAALNRAFPLYVALFIGCLWTLLLALAGTDVDETAAPSLRGRPCASWQATWRSPASGSRSRGWRSGPSSPSAA